MGKVVLKDRMRKLGTDGREREEREEKEAMSSSKNLEEHEE